jgi:hypothetical protein
MSTHMCSIPAARKATLMRSLGGCALGVEALLLGVEALLSSKALRMTTLLPCFSCFRAFPTPLF